MSGLTDIVIREDFYGSDKPTQQALFGIKYQDTKNLILYKQNKAPFGDLWIKIKENYSPRLNTVRASEDDPNPGYIEDKIDGVTLKLDPVTQKIYVDIVSGDKWVLNEIPIGAIDGFNQHYLSSGNFQPGKIQIVYNGSMQPPRFYTEDVGLNGFTLTFVPDPLSDLIIHYIQAVILP